MQPKREEISVRDSSGRECTLFKVTSFKNVGTGWIDRLPEIFDAHGHVTQRPDGTYEGIQTGEIYTPR